MSDTCNDTQRFFCAELRRQHSENGIGTASHFQSLFLLEYSGPWGKKALAESDLSQAVKDHLKSQLGLIDKQCLPRLLLVKRNEKQVGEIINFFAVSNDPTKPYYNHYKLTSYDDLLTMDFAEILKPQETSSVEPLYLICTNGNKDKCCAKFGMSCYKELQRHVSAERIWQCTHVGGDRFAPNMVMAPQGFYFGSMPADDMAALAQSCEQGQIDLRYFRGRAWYKKEAQSAEHYIRRERSGVTDLEFIDIQVNDKQAVVTMRDKAAGQDIKVAMILERSEQEYYLSCENTAPGFAEKYQLVSISSS